MQTILIVSFSKSFINQEIEKLKKKLKVFSFNFYQISPSPSIGIEDVRKIQDILSLRPYGGGERLIVIDETEKATIEAQNALLKILEEPPPQTCIVLTCQLINKLLPTVVSRCLVIVEKEKSLSPKIDNQKIEKLFQKILRADLGERLLLGQESASSKEEAIILLTSLSMIIENLLHQSPDKLIISHRETALILTKVEAARKYLERNVNYKAVLDILFLGFPSLDK